MRRAIVLVPLLAAVAAATPGDGSDHWKDAAAGYRIEVEASRPRPLTLRDEAALSWTNPQRRTDDGAVFLWLDRGRPAVAASFYKYKADGKPVEDHEFVSLSTFPITAKLAGEVAWSPSVAGIKVGPIPGAPALRPRRPNG